MADLGALQSGRSRTEAMFGEAFDGVPQVVVRAPGRVNLIGEHTDYNDGFVFPAAIDRSVWVGAKRRGDSQVRLYAGSFDEQVSFDVPVLRPGQDAAWANYPKGVIHELAKLGFRADGFEAVIWGDVPIAAGLSSSAALEVATAFALCQLKGFEVDPLELVKLCQRAENQFVGVNCGIMDQFIATLGERDHALFLDCRSLAYEQVPLSTSTVSVVICNSGVERGLVDSEYNRRRRECEQGVQTFAELLPDVTALRDVSLEDFERYQDRLNLSVRKRCRHVITENLRVQQAAQRLKQGDTAGFGELMNQSHASMRDDYEISCDALNLLVELARGCPGTLGARLTGAGFGGCTVNLVENAYVHDFLEAVRKGYRDKMDIVPAIYVSAVVDGVGEA